MHDVVLLDGPHSCDICHPITHSYHCWPGVARWRQSHAHRRNRNTKGKESVQVGLWNRGDWNKFYYNLIPLPIVGQAELVPSADTEISGKVRNEKIFPLESQALGDR